MGEKIDCPLCPRRDIPEGHVTCPQCNADLSYLWKLQEVPYVFFNEAVQLSRKGDYIEAIQKVLASISLNPDFVDAYILLGNLYQEEKHEKEARGCFEKALSLLPETETELKRQLYSFLETRPVTKIKPKIRAFL